MKTEPVYLRWENTTPPHRKFYEVEVELSLFYPKMWMSLPGAGSVMDIRRAEKSGFRL